MLYYKYLNQIRNIIKFEDINKTILISSLLLLATGFLSFFSASLGFLNKAGSEQFFTNFVQMQLLSYLVGFILLIFLYFVNLKLLAKAALPIFVLSILIGLLVFIPAFQLTHGGGSRWVIISGFSFQPADFVKFSTVLLFASYFTKYSGKLHDIKYALLYPMIAILTLSALFFAQRDLGTLLVILVTICGLYILNDTKVRYFVVVALLGLILSAVYVNYNSYARDRISSLLNGNIDSYQTKQALISLGTGGFIGRGYGQSVQKFFHLPEPAGDSIFAVVGEETGLMGTVTVTLLYLMLIISSFVVAKNSDNIFNANMIYGIIFIFFMQFVINTGSMTKLIPLSGDTLPFFSKGGTSLIMNLGSLGLLLRLTRRNN